MRTSKKVYRYFVSGFISTAGYSDYFSTVVSYHGKVRTMDDIYNITSILHTTFQLKGLNCDSDDIVIMNYKLMSKEIK